MSTVGQGITAVVGGVVGFFVGGPAGAVYGFGLGLAVGGMLFPPEAEVPSPSSGLKVQTSQYGIPVRYMRGRNKVAGNLLWYGNFKAHEEESDGKGGGGQVVGYTYTASLAFGLCVVPAGCTVTLLRAWQGSEELELEENGGWLSGIFKLDYSFYDGTQTGADSHIAQFVPRAPVWKRLCYIVLPNFNLGNSSYLKNLTFEIQVGDSEDALPTQISTDILTDDLFGLGLTGVTDADAFAETAEYCTDNDLLISPIFDRQVSVLDALSHVIAHHNGYISYEEGTIAHRQLKSEISLGTIRDHHLVREEEELPLSATSPGGRDYNNKITVEYPKRGKEYVTGTAPVDDMVDIDQYGLRDATVKLDAITTHSRASKLAMVLLKKSLSAPQSFDFKVGPELAGIRPGQVFALTETAMDLFEAPIRIASVSESDNYEMEVSAREEVDVYGYQATGTDTSVQPVAPDLTGNPLSVVRPLMIEIPPYYSADRSLVAAAYSRSASAAWAGASVWRAYTPGGSYERVGSELGSPVTGRVIAVGEGTLDVEMDWDATLSSALSFDDLVVDKTKNLFVVTTAAGEVFAKFQTVELLAPNQWRLSGLIYDLAGIPRNTTGDIAVNDDLALYQGLRIVLEIPEADRYRTLYYKIPSFNFAAAEQSLSDCAEIAKPLAALVDRPLPPCNVKVNGIGLSGSAIAAAGDIALEWVSRNRRAQGATNYERSDAVAEDADFQNFLVEFWSGGVLRRSFTQTGKSLTYTAAQQSADGAGRPLTARLSQAGNKATSVKTEIVIS